MIDNSGSMGGVAIIRPRPVSFTPWPPAAQRSLQRDPLRSHHGRAVPCGRAGRQGAYRPSHLCRGIAGQRAQRWCRRCAPRCPTTQAMPATSGIVPDRWRHRQPAIVRNHTAPRPLIFMVGIGSAPNTYLMTRAAEPGRGTFHPYRLGRTGRGAQGVIAKLRIPGDQSHGKFSDATPISRRSRSRRLRR